jgi:hypothetical protein
MTWHFFVGPFCPLLIDCLLRRAYVGEGGRETCALFEKSPRKAKVLVQIFKLSFQARRYIWLNSFWQNNFLRNYFKK